MIVKTFDYGWGPELETKKLEAEILKTYLRTFAEDESATVIINNTWYSDWAHNQTVESLRAHRPDRIVLVAMIDAANCQAERFRDFADDIRCIGYYGGPDEIDFWALAVDRWLRVPRGDLLDSSAVDTPFMCLNRKPHFHRPDRIVLVAMIDAANCQAERFRDFADDIRCIGYYGGPDEIDFWALAVDRWFRVPHCDLLDSSAVDTPFMCLNRKPHYHRQQLYDAMVAAGIVDHGLVSMGARQDGQPAQRSLPQDTEVADLNLNPNPGIEQTGIVNDIMGLGHDDNWRRIFLNIVTETQFNLRKTRFVSEKIYKPVLGLRPFLVYARDGAVPWLSQRGFEPYVRDFQDITDLDLAMYHNTVPFLEILCRQPKSYWQAKLVALREKILYNRHRFDLYVQEINEKIHKGIQCQI